MYKIYEINPAYVKYLKKFQEHVYLPEEDNSFGRRYIGIVLEIGNFKYFAPLTSSIWKKTLNEQGESIFVLDQDGNKKLKRNFTDVVIHNANNEPVAAVKLNDIIPIPINLIGLINITNIKELQLSTESKDRKYGALLELELEYVNRPAVAAKIKEKALDYYENYKTNSKYNKVCLDFKLLEEKSLKYSMKKKEESKDEPEIDDECSYPDP